MPDAFPLLVFATPKKLPDARALPGRVAVLDLGFCAQGLSPSFENMTGPFLDALGDRLCAWVDHHDHPYHERYRHDPRFVLATKEQQPACAPMVTAGVVERLGPADTLVAHLDFDGVYCMARWILGGREPYPGADADAVAVDTRTGEPSARGRLVDFALRARYHDENLKIAAVRALVDSDSKSPYWDTVREAAREYEQLQEQTMQWVGKYVVSGDVAWVVVPEGARFDRTELLLHGQRLARVAVVENSGMLALAAPFGSGVDFLRLFHTGGGMPTRVTLPIARRAEVREKLGLR